MVFSSLASITNIIRQYLQEQVSLGGGMEEGWRAGAQFLARLEKLPCSVRKLARAPDHLGNSLPCNAPDCHAGNVSPRWSWWPRPA